MSLSADSSSLRAALDLGSNSFHLLLVREARHGFVVVERLKEKVQLLSGFADGRLQTEAYARGEACLQRFAQRLASVEPHNIRSMGTYALRQAQDVSAFAAVHQRIVGVPLEIISGEREAGLVYQAVDYYVGSEGEARLVIDIGGGSTEIAAGHGAQADTLCSVNVGCVALKDRFANRSAPDAYQAAKAAAHAALDQALADTRLPQTPVRVFGTSGTIESIQTVLRANGLAWDTITADGLDYLESAIIEERWLIEAGVPGLAPDRIDIFPAGLAVLAACFERIGIAAMQYVDVSLLHGMVCETLGDRNSMQETDLKSRSVAALAQRFEIDAAQAARVERCAMQLLQDAGAWWQDGEDMSSLLGWAAQLHEIGMNINARHYHRHGGYVIKHADLPGLSSQEQSILALLVRGHRRSLPGLAFRAFDPALGDRLLRLVALLRIAVILERSHSDADAPKFTARVTRDAVELELGSAWLEAHPLSARELEVEAAQLASAGLGLRFS